MQGGTVVGILQSIIGLSPLREADRERFIRDGLRAFQNMMGRKYERRYSILHSRAGDDCSRDIRSILFANGSEAFEIKVGDASVGGVVIRFDDTRRGRLDLLFVAPCAHGCGIGSAAWQVVEQAYPEIQIWRAEVPVAEKRNAHFLVAGCGFSVVNRRSCPVEPMYGIGKMEWTLSANTSAFIQLEKVMSAERSAQNGSPLAL